MQDKRICIVGAGYIGMRLCKALLDRGYRVLVITRSANSRLRSLQACERLEIIEWDLTRSVENHLLEGEEISHVYYLVHSMTGNYRDFGEKEVLCVKNLAPFLKHRKARHLVYLGALCSQTQARSRHFSARYATKRALEQELGSMTITTLKASIVLGSGSASFEIIRDLVKKLPIMIAPKWIHQKCQPTAIADVLQTLLMLLDRSDLQGSEYDLCGDEALSFYDLMHLAAKSEQKSPLIFTVPVLTPYLSALWLYFVTSVDFSLARALIESMRYPSISGGVSIMHKLGIKPLSMQEALDRAVSKQSSDQVLSSWTDSLPLCSDTSCLSQAQKREKKRLLHYYCKKEIKASEYESCSKRIWEIGGDNGWYAFDTLWKVRGAIDLLLGGIGLNRGRRSKAQIYPGDCIDFWRVIKAQKSTEESSSSEKGLHLLLFAQMLLPGKAWLELRISPQEKNENMLLEITAHFLPSKQPLLGLFGKLYWYGTYPLHVLLFGRLLKRIASNIN